MHNLKRRWESQLELLLLLQILGSLKFLYKYTRRAIFIAIIDAVTLHKAPETTTIIFESSIIFNCAFRWCSSILFMVRSFILSVMPYRRIINKVGKMVLSLKDNVPAGAIFCTVSFIRDFVTERAWRCCIEIIVDSGHYASHIIVIVSISSHVPVTLKLSQLWGWSIRLCWSPTCWKRWRELWLIFASFISIDLLLLQYLLVCLMGILELSPINQMVVILVEASWSTNLTRMAWAKVRFRSLRCSTMLIIWLTIKVMLGSLCNLGRLVHWE